MIHLHIEVAETLEVVPQTPVALIQQILIDRAFFKHGNQALQPFGADFCAFHTHFHHRSAICREREVRPLRIGA